MLKIGDSFALTWLIFAGPATYILVFVYLDILSKALSIMPIDQYTVTQESYSKKEQHCIIP